MRKLCLIILAFAVILSMTALAQYPPKEPAQKDQAAQAPLKSIAGTVKAEGDITFVADKDQKSWAVENPEALKGHERHHVQVKAHVYADKGICPHHGGEDAEGRDEERRNEKVNSRQHALRTGRREAALFCGRPRPSYGPRK